MSAEDWVRSTTDQVMAAIRDGYRTTLDIEHHLGIPRAAVVSRLTYLERTGWARYHRQTDSYDLTEAAPMFNRKPAPPTIPPAAAAHSPATAAGATNLEAQRDDLVHAMDPHALAIDAVGDDSVLLARLDAALEQGMPSPDLRAVPRYRRAAAVETALDDWAQGTLGGPCSICGCTVARRGYLAWRSIDGEPPTPSFNNGKCDFCREILRTMDEDRLLRHVFSAKVGLRNFDVQGHGKFIPTFAELREQMPSVRPTVEPWGYVPRAALEGILKGADFPRYCFITTERDSLIHSFDGIVAPIHDPASLPAPKERVPIFVERSEREKREAKEWEEFQARSAAFRASFKAEQERSIDIVYPPSQAEPTPADSATPYVAGGILVPLGLK